MERTLIANTIDKIGEKVKISGWVATRRDHGKLVFLDVIDRTGQIQVVGKEELSELKTFFVIEIEGTVQKRPTSMINKKIITGEIEIASEKVNILNKAEELPFDMGTEKLNLELPTLLDNRALTLRHPTQKAILKVQEVVVDSFREALKKKDFVEFQAPSIIPEIPEGGAQVFEVKYFDNKAYLSQSPQLYKQILVGAFERVFSVNKIFRAEPSVTTRHITEAVSLDAEFGFIDSWMDVVRMAEYTIKYIFDSVKERCKEEFKMFETTLPKVSKEIPVIKLREAQEIIYKRTKVDHRKEKDLAPEDEREICKWALEEYGSELIFISHFVTKSKPFYTYPDPENPEFNQGFDLIGRGVEWLSGGRRVDNYEMIVKHAKEWGLDANKIRIYLEAFKYGMPPEGGFAFGAERITQGILGLKNIREATAFPRDMERVDVKLSGK
jgi:nondiscriminating aspartyl-tRNA synthetase